MSLDVMQDMKPISTYTYRVSVDAGINTTDLTFIKSK